MRKEGEKEKKGIVWGKKSCKALHWEQENKGNQGCYGWTTCKNGPECRLKTYLRRRETEESGVDLSMKRPTLGSLKTRQAQVEIQREAVLQSTWFFCRDH